MRAEFPNISYGLVGLWTPNDGAALSSLSSEDDCSEGRGLCSLGPEAVRVIKNWMPDMIDNTDAVQKADWLVLHDYFTKASTALTNEQLLNNSQLLHQMPLGVKDFIAHSTKPQTPMPKLALTEFNIATTYSGSSNATARLVSALFLGTLIGEALTAQPVAALTEFGWHAKWSERATPLPARSGSYGMVTFGGPSWASDDPGQTPLPKLYGQALMKLATGSLRVGATLSGNAAPTLKAYASEFYTGELGVALINTDPANGVAVDLAGLASSAKRATLFAKGVAVNGWVLAANASTVLASTGGTTLLDASGVTINGVGNGRVLGGPWPIFGPNATVVPYTLTAPSAAAPLRVDVPAASMVALIVHGARAAYPSPPPSPPYPPPSPPPPCFTAAYGACLDTHCCENPQRFGCYKRPTLQYAQCRPLQHPCTDSDDWLCPGWWNSKEEDDE
jgi:hypothetical protein